MFVFSVLCLKSDVIVSITELSAQHFRRHDWMLCLENTHQNETCISLLQISDSRSMLCPSFGRWRQISTSALLLQKSTFTACILFSFWKAISSQQICYSAQECTWHVRCRVGLWNLSYVIGLRIPLNLSLNTVPVLFKTQSYNNYMFALSACRSINLCTW